MNSFRSPLQEVAPLIDGALSHSDSDTVLDVINPSNGQHCFSIPVGSVGDVNRAVASARRVFEAGHWSEDAASVRKHKLHRLADLIEKEAKALDALDAGEMGKPVNEIYANAASAADLMHFFAEAADKVMGGVHPSDKYSLVLERWVPKGVVAAIVPWNFPTFNAVLKIAPALAAGNSVVLKPSELSSRSAVRLGQLALAELPPGVLNVLPGLGETVGRGLALHHGVDMVAFTGSTAVGKLMLEYAGRSNMKAVVAECGGKSPHIVFPDGVDLDAAAKAIAEQLVINQGQLCSVGSRLVVHRLAEEEMLAKIVARLNRIVMGDALDPKTTFGPIVSERQCSRVMQYIKDAQTEGARLLLGGRRALTETGGYFIEPTVFRDVPQDARIAQEEIFGPVLSVTSFESETEALRIANGTMYGLAAYVWTADLSRGMRMAKGIRSPVMINAAAPCSEGAGHAAAWEPAGASGTGAEGGLPGLETYMRRQLVWFNHS